MPPWPSKRIIIKEGDIETWQIANKQNTCLPQDVYIIFQNKKTSYIQSNSSIPYQKYVPNNLIRRHFDKNTY